MFEDKGIVGNLGNSYKKIKVNMVHMVHAVKHDGRHKAHLVAGAVVT